MEAPILGPLSVATTCTDLYRFYSALSEDYPESFYLLVEWFESFDLDGYMLQQVRDNGYLQVLDLPFGPTREKYKGMAFMVTLGFELRAKDNQDIVHYHQVSHDVMFRLREYIRVMRYWHATPWRQRMPHPSTGLIPASDTDTTDYGEGDSDGSESVGSLAIGYELAV